MNFTNNIPKPAKRSKLRQKMGKLYYRYKRRWKWLISGSKYSTKRQKEDLPNLAKEHSSTLLRPLKDVDMQLQHNKITNLRLALEKLDGLILDPRGHLSFWKQVGNPTKSKGYLPGLVLDRGNIDQGIGGGLCQMGNLIYWMTLHTPLKVTERYRHSYDVFPDVNRTLPFGSGATLSYNYIDLQIHNPTDQQFQLRLWLTEEKLHGSWRHEKELDEKYEVFESEHKIVQQQWGGYTRHNEIKRKITKLSGEEREEVVTQNHAIMMYNPMLES